jgi:FkbM family methyltransferase
MNIQFTFPEVRTVIDVGASDGRWSLATRSIFPNAEKWLMVEPLIYPKQATAPQFIWEHAVASDSNGTIQLSVSEDSFGSGVYDKGGNLKDCPAVTLDSLIDKHNLKGPFFLKTDAHGMEYRVFCGLHKNVLDVSGLLMELYNFPEALSKAANPWWDIVSHVNIKGFRPLDIVEVMRRSDKVLWQMDVLFARHDRAEFQRKSYI